jgi:hypothetical protein
VAAPGTETATPASAPTAAAGGLPRAGRLALLTTALLAAAAAAWWALGG